MTRNSQQRSQTRNGVNRLLTVCASILPEECVLIVSDFETLECASLIAHAGLEICKNVQMVVMPARVVDGAEPTTEVAEAMMASQVILMTVSKSLAHSTATRNALAAGARILSLTATSMELLGSDAYRADFVSQRPICEKVGQLLTAADSVSITTPFGTNLIVSAKGRQGQSHSCIVDKPGQFSSAPNIEASFSPVEGTMNGVFVADSSIPYLGIGLLKEPVIFEIENGRVVTANGGAAAERLLSVWKSQDDECVYNIAQVAIGLNPCIPEPIGRLGCNYDEGAFGTAHIGIGTSTNLGGGVKATTHFDALMTRPTIRLDGVPLLDDGKLCISP